MKVERQTAKKIINATNLVNHGELHAEAIYLHVSDQQVQQLIYPDQSTLKAQFGIDYLSPIVNDFGQKKIIDREAFSQVENLLIDTKELAIIGSPGVGKTCLLYQLSKKPLSTAYIKLGNKSLKTVILYLINRVHLQTNSPLLTVNDGETALEIFQQLLLSNSGLFFIIDDCEKSPEILDRICPLDKGGNTLVYGSQIDKSFTKANILTYDLDEFDVEECQKFLECQRITLNTLEFTELYKASKGNPLYLFYFSKYTLKPLPKGIKDYQLAIWANIESADKEILISIAISHLPLNLQTIQELDQTRSLEETTARIKNIRLISIADQGQLYLFHPAFRDFIVDELESLGTLKHYQVKLGIFFKARNEFAQAAVLLMESQPELIQDFGFQALPTLINGGDLEAANRVIYLLLEKKRPPLEEGYLKFHLYANLRLLNGGEGADLILEDALALLKKSKDKKFYAMALMNQAIDLIEKGDNEKGLALADSILTGDKRKDKQFSGQLLVSLSKIYIDLHQYEKSAQVSKEAYEYFCIKLHAYGMLASLSNLASALGKIDSHEHLAEEYALKLLSLPIDKVFYGIKLIALNILTSVNRQKKNYASAKKYGFQAVSLCQTYKLDHKTILNLINYGNVFRDDGDLLSAKKIYGEAMAGAAAMDLRKEQARLYWIMSSLEVEQGEITKGLELIEKSIQLSEEINYDYGIAHGCDEQGAILSDLKQTIQAADSYEKGFHIFRKMGNMKNEAQHMLSKAILGYMEAKDQEKLAKLIKLSLESVGTASFLDLGRMSDYEENIVNIHDYYYKLTEYTFKTAEQNLTESYITYLEYCQKNIVTSRAPFIELLRLLAKNTSANGFVMAHLAILIEQSKNMLSLTDVKSIAKNLESSIDGWYFRENEFETILILMLPGSFNIELFCPKDEIMCVKLLINFALFTLSMSENLIIDIAKKESNCKVMFIKEDSLASVAAEKFDLSYTNDIQTEILGRAEHNSPLGVVISNTYEQYADLVQHRNNKCNLILIRTLFDQLLCHFYHSESSNIWDLSQPVFKRLVFLYGYTQVEDVAKQTPTYQVDLSPFDNLNFDI